MHIQRIGRNPSSVDLAQIRGCQISVYGETTYFAATPDRPIDPKATVAIQTRQMLKRVDERLAMVGSDKSRILFVHIMLADIRFLIEMNEIWDAWVDQDNPPVRACVACGLASPDLKVEILVTAASG